VYNDACHSSQSRYCLVQMCMCESMSILQHQWEESRGQSVCKKGKTLFETSAGMDRPVNASIAPRNDLSDTLIERTRLQSSQIEEEFFFLTSGGEGYHSQKDACSSFELKECLDASGKYKLAISQYTLTSMHDSSSHILSNKHKTRTPTNTTRTRNKQISVVLCQSIIELFTQIDTFSNLKKCNALQVVLGVLACHCRTVWSLSDAASDSCPISCILGASSCCSSTSGFSPP
jgi:hypothetical protein